MKNLDIILGIIATVSTFMVFPAIPDSMNYFMGFIVFAAQCILAALCGVAVAGITNIMMTRSK